MIIMVEVPTVQSLVQPVKIQSEVDDRWPKVLPLHHNNHLLYMHQNNIYLFFLFYITYK